jgi:DnaK suppressor protein
MNDEQLQACKNALVRLRDELQTSLKQSKDSGNPVSPDRAIGRLTRLEAIQSQQISLEMRRLQNARIQLVERALARVESGTYGICLRCEEEIAPKRLDVHPETPVCIRCATSP